MCMSKLVCVKPGQQVCSESRLHGHKDWQLSEQMLFCSSCKTLVLGCFLFRGIMKNMEEGGKKQGGTLGIMLKGYSYITAISYVRQKPEKWETQGHLLLLLSPKFNIHSVSFHLLEECT